MKRHWTARVITIALALIISLAVLGACSDDEPPSAGSPSPSRTSVPASRTPVATVSPIPSDSTATNVPFIAIFKRDGGESVVLSIEVADTPDERAIGLMNRESLPEDAGMLFDFRADVQTGFWMRNTLIPLSIAFVHETGIIVHIEDMLPQTEDLHYSPSSYRYAIEVNQGWYEDNGIAAGDMVMVEVEG